MRVPVFTADWPTAFNKFSRYLGRHWPAQPLTLNAAREATAYLFGYNSVHDIQRLYPDHSRSKRLNVDGMVNSMSLRALKKFGLNPLISTPLFRKAPWRDLELWGTTETYFSERFLAEQKKAGMLFIADEYHLYANYKTDDKVVKLFDQNIIPRFDYVVNAQGFIYRSGALESLINSIDLTVETLKEIDFPGSAQDFITESVLPLAWVPVGESLGDLDYKGEWKWNLPYMHEVERVNETEFVITHKGYDALYPGHYSFDEITSALVSIYKNEKVPPMSKQPHGDIIQIDQQLFIRPKPFEDYEKFLSNPIISWFSIPKSADKTDKQPDTNVIFDDVYNEHMRLRSWFSKSAPVSIALRTAGSDLTKPVIDMVFAGTFKDLKSLQAEGELVPEVGPDHEGYESECHDNQERIDEFHESGISVVNHHPELADYFDPVALGVIYNDFDGSGRSVNNCYQRSLPFLIYVFTIGMQAKSKTHLSLGSSQYWSERYYDPRNVSTAVFSGLFEGEYSLEGAMEAFTVGASMFSLFSKQDKLINDIETYSEFKTHTKSLPFLSVGRPYEPTRKSSNEHMSEKLKWGRKIGAAQVEVVNGKPNLTDSLVKSMNKQ